MGINKFKIKLDNKIYISIVIMSGNMDKPPGGQVANQKVSSTSISGTSIVKPTKENYYEVNTKNEKIIREKYVELEKTHREVQSEIQTFNKNYKQLLELNQLHTQPYFLSSFSLKTTGAVSTQVARQGTATGGGQSNESLKTTLDIPKSNAPTHAIPAEHYWVAGSGGGMSGGAGDIQPIILEPNFFSKIDGNTDLIARAEDIIKKRAAGPASAYDKYLHVFNDNVQDHNTPKPGDGNGRLRPFSMYGGKVQTGLPISAGICTGSNGRGFTGLDQQITIQPSENDYINPKIFKGKYFTPLTIHPGFIKSPDILQKWHNFSVGGGKGERGIESTGNSPSHHTPTSKPVIARDIIDSDLWEIFHMLISTMPRPAAGPYTNVVYSADERELKSDPNLKALGTRTYNISEDVKEYIVLRLKDMVDLANEINNGKFETNSSEWDNQGNPFQIRAKQQRDESYVKARQHKSHRSNLPLGYIPNNHVVLRCYSKNCNGENKIMEAIQFNNDNMIASGSTTFKQDRICSCTEHAFMGCGQRRLITFKNDGTVVFNPIGNSQINMVFFCTGCNSCFRYECLRKINENSSDYSDLDLTSVDENIRNILPAVNKHMIFRKPLFESRYGDNLEKVAASLEVGVTFKKSIIPIEIHAGLGSIQSKMGKLGLLGAVVGLGVAGKFGAVAGAAAPMAASLYSQRGGSGDPANNLPSAPPAIDVMEAARDVMEGRSQVDEAGVAAQNIKQNVIVAHENLSEKNQTLRDIINNIGKSSNVTDISGKYSTQMSAFTTDKQKYQLTGGKRYKDLQLTKTYEDFISELKKWKLSEYEDKLIQAFGNVKGGTMMSDDYKKHREEYKELQKLYIKDFNDGFGEFIDGFPFRSKDFSFLTGLKNSLDGDDDKAFVSDPKIKRKKITDLKSLIVEEGEKEKDRFLTELDTLGKIDLNSDSLISRLLNNLGINVHIDEDRQIEAMQKGFGKVQTYSSKQVFTPNIRAIGNSLDVFLQLSGQLDRGVKKGKYEEYINLTSQYIKLKGLNAELKRKYEPLKQKIDDKINTSQSNDKELQLSDVKYKDLLTEMCGRKAANFWYGEKDMKVLDYDKLKRFFEENELLFFPFYDLKLLKAINMVAPLKFTNTPATPADSTTAAQSVVSARPDDVRAYMKRIEIDKWIHLFNEHLPGRLKSIDDLRKTTGADLERLWNEAGFHSGGSEVARPLVLASHQRVLEALKLQPISEELGGGTTDSLGGGGGSQRGGSGQDLFDKLEELDPEKVEYMQEVLPLLDLLNSGQTKKQGKFEITQLMSQNNLLGNTSLNITGESIWQAPIDKQGLDIISPIQLLKIKKGLMEKGLKFYDIERSINADLEFKKQYEKELSKDSKKLSKEEKKKQKEEKKKEKEEKKAALEAKKNELINKKESGTITDQQIAQREKEIAQEEKQIEDQEDLDKKEQQLEQKEEQLEQREKTTDLSRDKLYTKDDLSKASSELDKLKMEMKRKEDILKSISKNIKLLKSQRHGEDSEQRQLQQIEYEQKQRELILFQKLVEQREEKLKVLKILTDKLSAKDEKERSEMMRRDEINRRQNFLSLQNEMNSITEKQSREMGDSVSGIQGEEINKLKTKLNSLEGEETNIQHNIVQNGGGRKRKDDLCGLLYKTESRKNRTKKKGINGRKNERKNDRSLRKRV